MRAHSLILNAPIFLTGHKLCCFFDLQPFLDVLVVHSSMAAIGGGSLRVTLQKACDDSCAATQKSLICSASDKMQLPGTQYSSATTLKLLVKILRRQTLQKDPTILNRCRSLNLG